MWNPNSCFALLLLIVHHDTAFADDDEAGFYWDGTISDDADSFYDIEYFKYDRVESVCHENNTITGEIESGETKRIDFRPKNPRSILGISLCRDEAREDCYVMHISGVLSKRVGYFWRKHSRNETGEKDWVPGKDTKLPSTLIKADVAARKARWNGKGNTVYRFFFEFQHNKYVRIRYDGGKAEQQKEMIFEVPNREYQNFAVASYHNDSHIEVEAAIGCSPFRQVQFEPRQAMTIMWKKPEGSLGIAFCTDSEYSECYVAEIVGISGSQSVSDIGNLKIYVKYHSLIKENGEEAWVPGLDIKTKGTLLEETIKFYLKSNDGLVKSERKYHVEFQKLAISIPEKFSKLTYPLQPITGQQGKPFNSTWDEERYRLSIDLTRQSNGLLGISCIDEVLGITTYDEISIPNEYQYATIGTRVTVDGKEENRADFRIYGPCFNVDAFRYMSETCKLNVLPKDPSFPDIYQYDIFSPLPGMTEAILVSEELKSKAIRTNLCISLVGMVGNKGESINVTATDASGVSNETIHIGRLEYDDFYPPRWQQVRLSIELPPAFQKIPLKVQLTAERPTPDSFVLLHEAKLCSFDGCGTPTPDGTPFIAGGKKANPAKYPWHVAIFKKEDERNFTYICGGTLVRADLVISAAHCFFDEKIEKVPDKGNFKFAVGKRINSLQIYEANSQFSSALEIFIAPRYKGSKNNFIHDIAVIKVNFTLSPQVLPACFDWYADKKTVHLGPGDVGEVAGWGLHEYDKTEPELYYAELPYVTYEDCLKAVPESFIGFVTTDKLCAGNINGSTVKKGDSGGGLVFKKGGVWYLRGVVSVGVPHEKTYTTFTEVSQFVSWIIDVLIEEKSQKKIKT